MMKCRMTSTTQVDRLTLPHFLQSNEVHGGRHRAVGRKAKDGARQCAYALSGHHVIDDSAQVVCRGAIGALPVIVDHEAVGATHPLQICACTTDVDIGQVLIARSFYE